MTALRTRQTWRVLLAAVLSLGLLAAVFTVVMVNPLSTAPQRADVVVIVSHASDGRHELAVELIADGVAENLVVSNHSGPRDRPGYELCHGRGVPESTQIWCMDPYPVSTAGEAQTFNEIAVEEGWESAIIVTSRTHNYRVHANFSYYTDLDIDVLSIDWLDTSDLGRTLVHEAGGFAKIALTALRDRLGA